MYQRKSNSHPWYIPECAPTIAHCNYYYRLYHRKRCTKARPAYRAAWNRYRKILVNAKISYAQNQLKLTMKLFVRKISNKILNIIKPSIINDTEVISSRSYKTKFFTTQHKTIRVNSHITSPLSRSTIFAISLSRLEKFPNSSKTLTLRRLVVRIKSLLFFLKLAQFLLRYWKNYWKRNASQVHRTCHLYVLFSRMLMGIHPRRIIALSAFLVSLINPLGLLSTNR